MSTPEWPRTFDRNNIYVKQYLWHLGKDEEKRMCSERGEM